MPVERVKPVHLQYDMIGAFKAGFTKHPQEVLLELGIEYQHATPQTMFDCWQLWNCINIPNPMPTFLSVKNWNPFDHVDNDTAKKIDGYDLNKVLDNLDRIRDYYNSEISDGNKDFNDLRMKDVNLIYNTMILCN